MSAILDRTPRQVVVEIYGSTGCGKTTHMKALYDTGEVFVPACLYTANYDSKSMRNYDGAQKYVVFDNAEYMLKSNGDARAGCMRAINEAISKNATVVLVTTGTSTQLRSLFSTVSYTSINFESDNP
ncbi:MAG: hypothetical protein CL916_03660 [Deltaproteobacteria bacterium]|nr:hypothetical protein [Deltaproteobacteria bacterium]